MKRTLALFIALWLALGAGISTVIVQSTGCAMVQPGNSALVVRAEQTAKISFTLIDGFLAYEKAHRDELLKLSPDIKKSADALRVEAPKAIEALRVATKAYKSNRTPANEVTLSTWLAVVDALSARVGELTLKTKAINV